MCGEPCRASPERENQSQRRAFISPTEKTKETRDIFRTTTLLGFGPSHGNGLLILFFRIPECLTCVNQEVRLEEGLQYVTKELLIFPKRPWVVEIRTDLLTHTVQKASFETPKASQDLNIVMLVITNCMSLVMGLHKLMNGLSVPHVNPTIRIPNHHEFHIVFIQSQKPMHHENWSGISNMAKNDLGKGC